MDPPLPLLQGVPASGVLCRVCGERDGTRWGRDGQPALVHVRGGVRMAAGHCAPQRSHKGNGHKALHPPAEALPPALWHKAGHALARVRLRTLVAPVHYEPDCLDLDL